MMSDLTSLKHLDLRYNKLRKLNFSTFPRENKLDQFLTGFNRLVELDGLAAFSHSLSVIDLRDNLLAVFPTDILFFTKLKVLEISNNNLSDLPFQLGYMQNLQNLKVDGNILRRIRRGVLSSGTESLKKYLRSRDPNPATESSAQPEVLVPVSVQKKAAKSPGPTKIKKHVGIASVEGLPIMCNKSESTAHKAQNENEQSHANTTPSGNKHESTEELRNTISEMENDLLNNLSLTRTRKLMLKKQLARERGKLNRLLSQGSTFP